MKKYFGELLLELKDRRETLSRYLNEIDIAITEDRSHFAGLF